MTTLPDTGTAEVDLKTLFRQYEIDKVAIIDDAFDIPRKGNVQIEALQQFLAQVGKNEDAKASWILHDIMSFEDFDDVESRDINDASIIDKLWMVSEKNECELSKVARNTIFSDHYQRRDKMDPLIKFLRDIDIEVTPFPSSSAADDLNGYKVIFIDYFLSLGPTGSVAEAVRSVANADGIETFRGDADAVETARALASEIYQRDKGRLFLLISSNEVTHEAINEFVGKANLVGGMFYFIKKDTFYDPLILHIKLSNVIKALPHSRAIQEFTEAIEASLDNAKDEFLLAMKKLSLEDYAHLYTLSLKSDGQPLGDYMLWLFESFFGYLLFKHNEDLRRVQRVLDSADFQGDMIRQIMPSQSVSDFHSHAMFQRLDDIVEIPENSDTVPLEASLSLGDIFVKDDKVLMVINAECDLAGQRRKFDSDLHILLIPGELIPLEKKISNTNRTLTQLFEHDDRKYRIIWNTKGIFSYRHADLHKAIKVDNGFIRRYRLKMPYCLEIQHAFVTGVSRVGIPVMPPVDLPVEAKIYYKRDGNDIVAFNEVFDGVYITSRRINPADEKDKYDEKRICFTEGFLINLIENLRQLIEDISDNPSPGQRLIDYRGKIEKLLDPGEMSKITKAGKLKSGGRFNDTSIIVTEKQEPTSLESIGICILFADETNTP